MARPVELHDLERFRYWQGQTLRSRDFRDEDTLDEIRRSLHNRALHAPFGVSLGLAVTPKEGGAVVVGCGVAYDCAGRALILGADRELSLPAGPAALIIRLAAAAQSAASACCARPTAGDCSGMPGVLDLQNPVELVWLEEAPAGAVVLARAGSSGLNPDYHAPVARPLARPRIARGETARGNTSWERWEIDEPDGQGGLRKKVIGVQTRIDTSAAGFTSVPCYFASLESPLAWDLDQTEFAPAFFPQVAEPTVDGFLFRLLMVETARRRYESVFGTARVSAVSRGVGERLILDVDDAGPFRKDDAISLLRPRGSSALFIKQQSGRNLTLAAPLPAEVTAGATRLALGNAPRAARVMTGMVADPPVLVTVASPVTVRKNDLLVRFSDSAVTVVNGTASGALRVHQPFPNWKAEDPVGLAQVTTAVGVSSVTTPAGATVTTIVLTAAAHGFDKDKFGVLLAEQHRPLNVMVKVAARNAATIDVEPALSAADSAALKEIALVRSDISVTVLRRQTVVKVDSADSFREGDWVAGAGDASRLTVVDKVDKARKEISLRDAIPLPAGSLVVAANWLCATLVQEAPTAAEPRRFAAGRAGAVPAGSFVALDPLDAGAGFSPVQSVSGNSVTLTSAISGLSRLTRLAVGMIPAVATVVDQEAPGRLIIAPAGSLRPGDSVVRMSAGPLTAAVPVGRVSAVSGSGVTLVDAGGSFDPGDLLGVVHFRDTVRVDSIAAGDRTKLGVNRDIETSAGDFLALITHYADNSAFGVIEQVQPSKLMLRPTFSAGDGIVEDGWIDGGILGPAAVSFPDPFQLWLRLETAEGIDSSRPSIAYGLDQSTGSFRSSAVYIVPVDAAAGRVFLWPAEPAAAWQYRPETLSLVTTFNSNFSSAFVTFAQRQRLAVSWHACRTEFARPGGCPAHPDQPASDPCASNDSSLEN